jgi:opacity protein-like surface antigen
VGFSFSPMKHLAINLEYNRSSFDVKTANDVALVGTVKLKSNVDLNVLKLGVAYNF